MGSLNILIVDDDNEVGLFMKLKLGKEAPHFSIATAGSGSDCLEYVKKHRVDCILSDYQMPGMDGMELLRTLKEEGVNTPFIFLTGQGNEELAREAFKNGANDYFTKDIGFAHFTRLINSIEQAVRQDLAERSKVEVQDALMESEAQFRGLVEESLVGVSIIQDGRFAYANPRLAEIFGYAREELIRMEVMDTVLPADRGLVRGNILKRISGEVKSIHYRFRGVRKDGVVADMEVYGSQTVYKGRPAVISSLVEVAGAGSLDDALRESERRFRELLENVSLIAVMLDTEGRVLFCNDALLSLTGWRREEVIGKGWFHIFIPPEDRDTMRGLFLSTVEKGEFPPMHDNPIVTRGGEPRMISWSNTVLRDAVGRVIGTSSVGEDVTDLKRAEEDRSAYFHMITHDIKGPLSIIRGYGEIMLEGAASPDVAEHAGEMLKAARRISGLIDDMLSLASMEAGKGGLRLDDVPLAHVLRQAVRDSEAAALDMGVTVEVTADGPLPELYADRNLLGRAFGNLVSNAVNYNRQGGRVTVRAAMTDGGTDGVVVEVADTGMGIRAEDLPHIFEKYFRGKGATGARRGTGLGLAIVKAAVEAHGGTVTVASREREGTVFTVHLPVRQAG